MLANVILTVLILVSATSASVIRERHKQSDVNPFDLEFSRVTRAVDPEKFFKSMVSKMTSSAQDLNGVSLQLGVLDGSLNFDEKLAEMISLKGVDLQKMKHFDKNGMLSYFGDLKKIGAPIAKSEVLDSVPVLGDLVNKFNNIGDVNDTTEIDEFFSNGMGLLQNELKGTELEDPIKFMGEVIDFFGGLKGNSTSPFSLTGLLKSLNDLFGSKGKISSFLDKLNKFNPLKWGLSKTPQGKLAEAVKDGFEKMASDKLKSLLPDEVNDVIDAFKKMEQVVNPDSNDQQAVEEVNDDEKQREEQKRSDPTREDGQKGRGKCDRDMKPEDGDSVTSDIKDKTDPVKQLKDKVNEIKEKLNPNKDKGKKKPKKNGKEKKNDDDEPKAKKFKDAKEKAKELGKKAKDAMKKLKKCDKEKPDTSSKTPAMDKASESLKQSDLLKNGLNKLFRMFGDSRHANSTVMDEVQNLISMVTNSQSSGEKEEVIKRKLLDFDKEKNLTETLNRMRWDFKNASSFLEGFNATNILDGLMKKGKSALTDIIGDTVKKGFDKFLGCIAQKASDALDKVKGPLDVIKNLAGLKDKAGSIYDSIAKIAENIPLVKDLLEWPNVLRNNTNHTAAILKLAGLEKEADKFSIAVEALGKIEDIFEYKLEIQSLEEEGDKVTEFIRNIQNQTLKVTLDTLWDDWASTRGELSTLTDKVKNKIWSAPGVVSASDASIFPHFVGFQKIDLKLPARIRALEFLIPYSEYSENMERVKRKLVRLEPMVATLGEADQALNEMPLVFANIESTIQASKTSNGTNATNTGEGSGSGGENHLEATTELSSRSRNGTPNSNSNQESNAGQQAGGKGKLTGDESEDDDGIGTAGVIAIGAALFFLGVCCFFIIFFFYRRRKDEKKKETKKKKDKKKKRTRSTTNSGSSDSKLSKESGEEKETGDGKKKDKKKKKDTKEEEMKPMTKLGKKEEKPEEVKGEEQPSTEGVGHPSPSPSAETENSNENYFDLPKESPTGVPNPARSPSGENL